MRAPPCTYLRATFHQQIQLPVLESGAAARRVSIYCLNAPNEVSARRHMSNHCGVIDCVMLCCNSAAGLQI
jgi:hypothetical protein